MRDDFFVFGGINSKDYGVGIRGNHLFDAPERDYTSYEIPGKNGDLVIDNNRYKNKLYIYEAYIVKNFPANADGLRDALLSQKGYQRLEDTIHPDMFRMAIIKPFEIEMAGVMKGGEFNIEFDCKPQRFLKSGEHTISYTANGSIRNNTNQQAKPFLRVYGTGAGTVGIGSETITISAISSYVDIDCEIMDAFKGATNCNGNVSFSNDIIIQSGDVGITMTGNITKVDVTPRWWVV